MTDHEIDSVLHAYMATLRTRTYEQLVEHIKNRAAGDQLDYVDQTWADGTLYQIEANAFWLDKAAGDVVVLASLSAEPQRASRFLGIMKAYEPHASASFVVRPDGTVITPDETETDMRCSERPLRRPFERRG